jgi:hypothetical protein
MTQKRKLTKIFKAVLDKRKTEHEKESHRMKVKDMYIKKRSEMDEISERCIILEKANRKKMMRKKKKLIIECREKDCCLINRHICVMLVLYT